MRPGRVRRAAEGAVYASRSTHGGGANEPRSRGPAERGCDPGECGGPPRARSMHRALRTEAAQMSKPRGAWARWSLLFLLAAANAAAADDDSFDASAYEKKPFEIGGYLQLKREDFALNR